MRKIRFTSGHPAPWFVALAFILAFTVGCAGWFSSGFGEGQNGSGQTWAFTGLAAMPTTVGVGTDSAITATVTNPDSAALTYTWDGGGGTIVGTGAEVTWSTTAAGTYTITLAVSDAANNEVVEVVAITVSDGPIIPPNDPPAFVDGDGLPLTLQGDVTSAVATQRIRFTTMATDPDDDPITYEWSADGAGEFTDVTVGDDGTAEAYWAANAAGTYIITCTADDGQGGTASVSAVGTISTDSITVTALPTEFNTAGFETCGNCHADMVTGWQTTNHSDAITRRIEVDVPGAYGYRNESCYACHAAGYEPVGEGGFIDIELTPQFANIQCESCHGYYSGAGPGHMPMQWDPGKGYETDAEGNYIKDGFSYVYDETYDGSEGYGCGLCHMGTRHGAYEEYMTSGHAAAPLFDDEGEPASPLTSTGCVQCHNGGYFVEIQIRGNNPPVEDLTAENFNVNGSAMITCAVCHDPHSNQFEAQLRVSSEETVVIPFDNTEVGPAGKGMICMKCHNGRRTRNNYNSAINNGKAKFGAHDNPQAPVFWGLMGANLGAPADYDTDHAHNQMTPDACVTCHMYRKDYTSAEDPKQFGHDFVPKVEACQVCHGPGPTTLDEIYGDLNAEIAGLLQDFVDAWPAPWKDVSDPEYPVLENRDTDPATNSGPPRNDPNGNAYREALWNYELVENDGSLGVHNPAFVRDLLNQAIARLGELTPPPSADLSALSVADASEYYASDAPGWGSVSGVSRVASSNSFAIQTTGSPTTGGHGAVGSGLPLVTMKAVNDGTNFAMRFEWDDSDANETHNFWTKSGGAWALEGNEDRMYVMWETGDPASIGRMGQTFSEVGCAMVCHIRDSVDDTIAVVDTTTEFHNCAVCHTDAPGIVDADFSHLKTGMSCDSCHTDYSLNVSPAGMIAPVGGSYDVWHWKAGRSNPLGIVEDQYLPPGHRRTRDQSNLASSGNSVYSVSTGGEIPFYAFTDNRADGSTSYLMQSQLAAMVAADEIATWNEAGAFGPDYYLNDGITFFVPADGATIPRAIHNDVDVDTDRSGNTKAEGVWSAGKWVVVVHRAMSPGEVDGNTDASDIDFAAGVTYPFAFAVTDDSGINHMGFNLLYILFE